MIFPTAYLGCIAYYQHLVSAQKRGAELLLECWETYPKQTFRNRCAIYGANGRQELTVPVRHTHTNQFTKDIEISNQVGWQRQHLVALRSAYQQSPFYDYYQDFFISLYSKPYKYLIDWNEDLHELVCKLLGIDLTFSRTTTWQSQTDIDEVFDNTAPQKNYYQVFQEKHGFIENLSIVDLLFNLGPEARLWLTTK